MLRKILSIIIITFSFLKLCTFVSEIYLLCNMFFLKFSGKPVSSLEFNHFFNAYIFISSIAELILYIFSMKYAIGILREKPNKLRMLRVITIFLFVYYPLVFGINYFIYHRHNLMRYIPIIIPYLVFIPFALYLLRTRESEQTTKTPKTVSR